MNKTEWVKTVLITPFTAKMSPLFSDASKDTVHEREV